MNSLPMAIILLCLAACSCPPTPVPPTLLVVEDITPPAQNNDDWSIALDGSPLGVVPNDTAQTFVVQSGAYTMSAENWNGNLPTLAIDCQPGTTTTVMIDAVTGNYSLIPVP